MSRFVETRLPHLPVRGRRVPPGCYTVSTTSWMPWQWSLNNVVMGESAHTALALWQAGREEAAFGLFKGAILDSMYLGICPGNVGMCTWYDANRRESQRDFGDGVGALSRAFLEGLFGVTPDLLAGDLRIWPGFPSDWGEASIHHPSFDVSFHRSEDADRYEVVSRFDRPLTTRLIVSARRDHVAAVTSNGSAVSWQAVKGSIGVPQIEILVPAAKRQVIEIRWEGNAPARAPEESSVELGSELAFEAGAAIQQVVDPQGALHDVIYDGRRAEGKAVGVVGHRTAFARVIQGDLEWWQPLAFEIRDSARRGPRVFATDWTKPVPKGTRFEMIPLASLFNLRVDDLYQTDYVAPRPRSVSLSMPKQGFGSWCHPKDSFEVDDSGLRRLAGSANLIHLPNGVPLSTPGGSAEKNIVYVSRWENHAREVVVPLSGKASKIHLLMAGSTDGMKSRRDNGEVLIEYMDGSVLRLPLDNPGTWWPIDQDYFIDDYAFRRPGPLPVRIDLKTGKIRVLDEKTFVGKGRSVPGGAATVLDLELDPQKELKAMSVRAIANEVVIGLMSATLQRP